MTVLKLRENSICDWAVGRRGFNKQIFGADEQDHKRGPSDQLSERRGLSSTFPIRSANLPRLVLVRPPIPLRPGAPSFSS